MFATLIKCFLDLEVQLEKESKEYILTLKDDKTPGFHVLTTENNKIINDDEFESY